MAELNVQHTNIPGVLVIHPQVFGDARGYFFQSYQLEQYEKALGGVQFVQDNESFSTAGVLRGLHFQRAPYAQAKLVRVVVGCVLDVAVDIRWGSPTYGQHVAVELSAENKNQFFIPRGFAHGFQVLSDRAIFQYKCDNYYHPEAEGGIMWNDPALAIPWHQLDIPHQLSDKDQLYSSLASLEDSETIQQLFPFSR